MSVVPFQFVSPMPRGSEPLLSLGATLPLLSFAVGNVLWDRAASDTTPCIEACVAAQDSLT